MPSAADNKLSLGRGGYHQMHGFSLSQELPPEADFNLHTLINRLGPARARDGVKKLAFAFNAGYQAGKQVTSVTSAIKYKNADVVQHNIDDPFLLQQQKSGGAA